MTARWAKVVAVHPEAHAADLVFLDTGARVPMVPVLCDTVSTNTGGLDLPGPTAPAEDYDASPTKDRDVYAAVLMIGGSPAIVGFKVPEVCQMTFKRKNFRVQRHASDVYSTLDDAGNYTLAFPNGTYLMVGDSSTPEDLTGQDFDQKWAIKRNKAAAVYVTISVANGGVQKAKLQIDPSGNVSLVHAGNLTVQTAGNIASSAAAWNHHGPITVTGGDVTVDGIGVKAHHHTAQGATAPTTPSQA